MGYGPYLFTPDHCLIPSINLDAMIFFHLVVWSGMADRKQKAHHITNVLLVIIMSGAVTLPVVLHHRGWSSSYAKSLSEYHKHPLLLIEMAFFTYWPRPCDGCPVVSSGEFQGSSTITAASTNNYTRGLICLSKIMNAIYVWQTQRKRLSATQARRTLGHWHENYPTTQRTSARQRVQAVRGSRQ